MVSHISVGLSTSTGWPSRFIRWATKSKYSHAWIKFREDRQWWYLDSSARGVRKHPAAIFEANNQVLAAFDLLGNKLDISRALDKTLSYQNSSYDWKALLGQGLVVALGLLGKRGVKNPFRDKCAFICTELIWALCAAVPYRDIKALDRETITPEALFLSLSESSNLRRVS